MAEWMAWAIFGAVLVACLLIAMWVGGEHAPGETAIRGPFRRGKDTQVEAARGMAKAEGYGGDVGNTGFDPT